MPNFPNPIDDIKELVKRLQVILPEWTFDTVFDFGSHVRDEAVSESDIDLWVLVHSDTKILFDNVWQVGRYHSTSSQFLADHSSFDIVEIDTWGKIVPQVNVQRPLEISCPIADIRWFLWQLAHESDWQVFLYTVFGSPLFDPNGFLVDLKAFLWQELPFHIHQDHGAFIVLRGNG